MSEQKRPPTSPVTEDQSEVLRLLGSASTYGPDVTEVDRIDTHGAIVFLAGDRAYKMKRAVAYPYMDFSTLEKRRDSCRREMEINRRTAPSLYLDVVPITRTAAGLALGGDGTPVEWVLVMRRFDQANLLSRQAEAGRLTAETMTALADAVAHFHGTAEPRRDRAAGAEAMAWVVRENGEEFGDRPDIFDPEDSRRLTDEALGHLAHHAALLDGRAENGKVRLCHGDLHLRNVVLLDGRPTLFDAIEFNDAIARIDVVYDLAFLLMDLDHRGLRPFANLVLNRYLQQRDETGALPLLPVFLSTRAAVRAKVAASLQAVAELAAERSLRRAEATAYFERARAYLAPAPPRLVAVGGLSGTGKTTLARTLAPALGAAPGAIHLRSDVLRKQQAGVDELDRLPPQAYTAEASAAVYAALGDRAAAALAAGQAVIVDAVFARPEERAAIEEIARRAGVPFTGLWLEADADTLAARVERRRGDASDATAAVVAQQLTYDLGTIGWHCFEAGHPAAELADRGRRLLDETA
ncbi:MAG: AAA family ATPase [Kiloniellaceae bacterium]